MSSVLPQAHTMTDRERDGGQIAPQNTYAEMLGSKQMILRFHNWGMVLALSHHQHIKGSEKACSGDPHSTLFLFAHRYFYSLKNTYSHFPKPIFHGNII